MIVLIDVLVAKNQNIEVGSKGVQSIEIQNAPEQQIDVRISASQEINIFNTTAEQFIDVTALMLSASDAKDIELAIQSKVPMALSILPQVERNGLGTIASREASKIYIQVGEVPSFATLEQIKELNTKTIFVDNLTDSQVYRLSNEDIIMLRKE